MHENPVNKGELVATTLRPIWRILDEMEIAKGQEQGRPRVKFTDLDEMIAILDAQPQ